MSIRFPWYLKILLKIVLARLPISYRIWKKMGVFRHGQMTKVHYAEGIYRHHLTNYKMSPVGKTILEIGPGDSILTAVFAKQSGCNSSYLIDVGRFANCDGGFYKEVLKGEKLSDIYKNINMDVSNFDQFLNSLNSHYLTNGIHSLREIPDSSIDFIFSHSVLQHVKRSEIPVFFKELSRISKPGAPQSHRIDLKDMLDDSLNHLRFSPEIWESKLFQNSGFYTNRFRCSEIKKQFLVAGFEITHFQHTSWCRLPVPRKKLNHTYQLFTEDDLMVSGMDITLRKKYD